jgi:siroheme synthase-like protein
VPVPPSGYFPVSLNLAGRPCLIIGGGPVAARKARRLLDGGALVTVIAPQICDDMAALSPVTLLPREYAPGDVTGFRLVITATGITSVDGAVFDDAEAAGVWVNSADDIAHCSFIMPSVHQDGPVTVAISTGGTSPALASWLRRRVGADLGPGLGQLAALLGEARTRLRDAGVSTEHVDWSGLLDGPLPALVRQGRIEEARALLADVVRQHIPG